ncbi:MAG: proton-conducting transporter membrane subunit, partial [Bdellovibrionota bacterium]
MNAPSPTEWMTLRDFLAVLPMAALFAISLIPLLLKVFLGNRETNPFVTLIYNFIGLVVAAGVTAALFGTTFDGKTYVFSNALVLDGISVWMSYLVYMCGAVALMLSYDHMSTRGHQFTEYCFLMMSSVIGMLILIMSNDLIVSFIGIETMSLCLYILVAMSREEVLSKEAAFKYFILGSFASAIFLYGVALIYGTVGSTDFPSIALATVKMIGTNRIFLAGMALTILGFAFKVSVFPLHAWTPDVYQGAPTPVTAFMATAVKAATFVGFLR